MKKNSLFWRLAALLVVVVILGSFVVTRPALADDPTPAAPVLDEAAPRGPKAAPDLQGVTLERPSELEIKDEGQVSQALVEGAASANDTVTLVDEDFEGAFPTAGWTVSGHWGKRTCRPSHGLASAWVEGGSNLACGANYHHNDNSWMVFGPFSLSDATAATLAYNSWLNTEPNYDWLFVGASVNGSSFYGNTRSGSSAGWQPRSLDLNNVPALGSLLGRPQVWIGFVWRTDTLVTQAEGAYIDDIVVTKTVGTSGTASQEESDPAVRYDSWRAVANNNASGGTYRQSATEDATVRFTFTGTGVTWVTARGPDKGIAQVSIDEVWQGNVDLYAATNQWQVPIAFSNLPNGPHTLAIRVTGIRNAASSGHWVVVDGFRVP